MRKTNHIYTTILVIVCFFTFFVNNEALPTDFLECRNIAAAREMADGGTPPVPTPNGEPHLEQPPLATWLAAGAETLFPGSLGAQRAVAGIGGLLLVCYFFRIGRELIGTRFAFIASLVLCTCHPVVMMGRTATGDIWCHAFMAAGIFHLIGLLRNEHPWRNALLCGLFTGLSLLSKGPVALYALLLPFAAAYAAAYRPSLRGKGRHLLAAAATACVSGGWWYAYRLSVHTEAATQAFTQMGASWWVGANVCPWYYCGGFVLESGVWTPILLTALIFPLWRRRITQKKGYRFALLWTIGVVVVLSLLPAKEMRYLPMLLPAALLTGLLIDYWGLKLQRKRGYTPAITRQLFRLNALIPGLMVCLLPTMATLYMDGPDAPTLSLNYKIALWAIGLYILYTAFYLRPYGWLGGIVGLFLMAESAFLPLVAKWMNNADCHRPMHPTERPEAHPATLKADDDRTVPMSYYNKVEAPANRNGEREPSVPPGS